MPGITIIATTMIGHLVALFPSILALQSSHFTHLAVFLGTKGRNKGEFTNLQGVAASQGKVLIADSNNQCVQVNTTLQLWSHNICIHTLYLIPYWFFATGVLKRWPV